MEDPRSWYRICSNNNVSYLCLEKRQNQRLDSRTWMYGAATESQQTGCTDAFSVFDSGLEDPCTKSGSLSILSGKDQSILPLHPPGIRSTRQWDRERMLCKSQRSSFNKWEERDAKNRWPQTLSSLNSNDSGNLSCYYSTQLFKKEDKWFEWVCYFSQSSKEVL